jgi:hypothetical protein
MPFLTIDIYLIGISFLVSLSAYLKTDPAHYYLRLFPPFLFLTFLAESMAAYMGSIGENNLAIYNLFSLVEFSFYAWIISLVVQNEIAKRVVRIAFLVYLPIALINIIFIQKIKTLHTVTYSLGCLLITLCCVYYFLELFRYPKSVKLSRTPAFWICSGLLFFYACGFPLFALMHYWQNIEMVVKNFDNILTTLNLFLYSMFIIAFLCIRARKYTSSPS